MFMNEHSSSKQLRSLDDRFADDPKLRERFHQIADVRDELLAQGLSMDKVEERTIKELRLLGQELMNSLAQQQSKESTAAALRKNPSARAHRKKK
jgi:hypothetical protein